MRTSEEVDKILPALGAVIAGLPEMEKEGYNPHFKSKYATFPAIMAELKPLLRKHGLIMPQDGAEPLPDGRYGVLTRFIHLDSLQWAEFTMYSGTLKDIPHQVGSLQSYLKRYSVLGALEMAPNDGSDDDGNDAGEKRPSSPGAKEEPHDDGQGPTDDDFI